MSRQKIEKSAEGEGKQEHSFLEAENTGFAIVKQAGINLMFEGASREANS